MAADTKASAQYRVAKPVANSEPKPPVGAYYLLGRKDPNDSFWKNRSIIGSARSWHKDAEGGWWCYLVHEDNTVGAYWRTELG